MRVLFVVDSLTSGGAQRQLVELAAWLHGQRDFEVMVGTYHPGDFFRPRLEEAGVPIHRISARGRLSIAPGLAWLLRTKRVDIVHAFLFGPVFWSGLAVFAARHQGRPRLVAAQRSTEVGGSLRADVVQRFVYPRCDAVTVNAGAAAAALAQSGVPRSKLHYLPNGIDLDRWDAMRAEPSELHVPRGRFNIGVCGAIRPEKNQHAVVRALSRMGSTTIREWRVWLIGDGVDRERGRALQREVDRLSLHDIVRFSPPVRNLAAVMRQFDVLVLPSLHEGFPNVVLEAMASRLPVVATNVGEISTLVEDGTTGFVVRPGDDAALGQAIARAAALSAGARAEMGRRARNVVEDAYTLGSVGAEYANLYRSITTNSRDATR